MREYGAHTWPLHHIVETCCNRHRPGQIALLIVPMAWTGRGRKIKLIIINYLSLEQVLVEMRQKNTQIPLQVKQMLLLKPKGNHRWFLQLAWCLEKHKLEATTIQSLIHYTCVVAGRGGCSGSVVLLGEHVSQRAGLSLQRWSWRRSDVLSQIH